MSRLLWMYFKELCGINYLVRLKRRDSMRKLIIKKDSPVQIMAHRLLPVTSHEKGNLVLFP